MRIAMVAAKFSDAEVNELRRRWRHSAGVGTIGLLEEKMVARMAARGYDQEFAARCFNQIKGFGEYGFPESHAASFAHARLRLVLAQMSLPGGFRLRAAELAADGVLRAGADRARCARAWRRGAGSGRELFATGIPRWRRRAGQPPGIALGLRQIDGCAEEEIAPQDRRRETRHSQICTTYRRAGVKRRDAGEARGRRCIPLAGARPPRRPCGR